MKTTAIGLLIVGLTAVLIIAGGRDIIFPGSNAPEPSNTKKTAGASSDMPRYRVGELQLGVMVDPAVPRVGENRLIVEIHDGKGQPVSMPVEAYAEMPAMGSMAAMRAPADLEEIAPGRYEGWLEMSMRGEWPLTITLPGESGTGRRLQFDLATDRADLDIAAGGSLIGAVSGEAVNHREDDSNSITIDNRRRQLIGVTTAEVTYRDLSKSIRAVGNVTIDERRLSAVVLKFDGYIGELFANFVGARVRQGEPLFTVYSPELLAAQQQYLAAQQRQPHNSVQQAVLNAARQRLALWDISAEQIAALEKRGEPQPYVTMQAPHNGTLIERHISAGSAAKMGQKLLAIADLSRLWVDAQVYEQDLQQLTVGMTATVTLPYLAGRSYSATVEYIYPFVDKHSRTGRVRLSLDNSSGELKPDMYAEVKLQVDLGHQLAVPEEAILFAGDSRVVFVDLGAGRLKPLHIKTGNSAQGYVQVLDGLSQGDIVVTSGNFLIAAETRLKTGIKQW